MNPENPLRNEVEARLTALLLGELPENEAALLRWAISQDAELQKLHDRLKLTVGLVREVAKNPEAAPAEAAALKLSAERRAKLLAHFKSPRPAPKPQPAPIQELPWLKRIDLSRIHSPNLLAVFAVLAVVALLAAISLPNFVKARATSKANVIVNNVRQLDAAKQQWALENKKTADDVPTEENLKPYLANGKMPSSVSGETYRLGRVGDEVTANPKLPLGGTRKFASALTQSDAAPQASVNLFAEKPQGQTVTGPAKSPAVMVAPPTPPPAEPMPDPVVLGGFADIARGPATANQSVIDRNVITYSDVSGVTTAPAPANQPKVTPLPSTPTPGATFGARADVTYAVGGGTTHEGTVKGLPNDSFDLDDRESGAKRAQLPGSGQVAAENIKLNESHLAYWDANGLGGSGGGGQPEGKSDAQTANSLVQDGKALYEAGKLNEARDKFAAALKNDPNNSAAHYYDNLNKQAEFARNSSEHTADTQERLVQVEKNWNLPSSGQSVEERQREKEFSARLKSEINGASGAFGAVGSGDGWVVNGIAARTPASQAAPAAPTAPVGDESLDAASHKLLTVGATEANRRWESKEQMEPLKTELPPPLLVGTPVPIAGYAYAPETEPAKKPAVQQAKYDDGDKVPVLGDAPVVGELFQSKNRSNVAGEEKDLGSLAAGVISGTANVTFSGVANSDFKSTAPTELTKAGAGTLN